MTINAGFDKEDPRIPGLAHFCEHMLFLGTETYKQPSYFVDFITLSGGHFNGYTDFSNSAYFYKINNFKFKQSLKIFSRFFIDPLFSESSIEKEVNAVNSEFERNLGLDSRRKEMILRDSVDKDSVFNRFSTGNTDTLLGFTQLNNFKLRDAVVEFYKKHYRPDNMKLIIYGKRSIKYYKGIVDEFFKDLQVGSEPYNSEVNTKPPWEQGKMGKMIFYETINQHQELDITILIPDIHAILPENPALYYKIVLNYSGKDSLGDYLRDLGYATGLRAHIRRVYKGACFFKLTGFLTKKGIKYIDEVIKFIFSYINFIKEKALDKELYDYIKESNRIRFFYAHRRQSVMETIRDLTSIMHKYPEEYYLAENMLLPEFNENVLKDFGNSLIITNAIITVGNNEFDSNLTERYESFMSDFNFLTVTEKRSPHYGAKYNIFNLSEKFIGETLIARLDELHEKNIDLFPHHRPMPKVISLARSCEENKDATQKKPVLIYLMAMPMISHRFR